MSKHFSVQKDGDEYIIKKYTPTSMPGGERLGASAEVWRVPANLFRDEYWKELEELNK